MARIELRDARTGKPTGTIPFSVLDDMVIVIPDDGSAYWFSKELTDAIKRHPDWENLLTKSAPAGSATPDGDDDD